MKTKKTLSPLSAMAFATAVFILSSPLHGQTWDGGGLDASWGTAENWDGDALPTFGTTANVTFSTTANLTSGNNTFLGVGRQIRSLTFGADVDSALAVAFSDSFSTVADARLTFANTAANFINVLAGSTGDINIGNPSSLALAAPPASSFQISGNLTVDHNGSGLLTFSRPISTNATFDVTKTGNGTLQTNNNNLITGALNVNGGRLIGNSYTTNGDWLNVSSINLGGGTLQYNFASGAGNKFTARAINVTAATNSGLAFFNPTTTAASTLTINGTTAFSIGAGANLTVATSTANMTRDSFINITRNATGSGNMIVETYNNINSSTTNLSLGRVALGGNNTAWSGNLEIRRGTAEIYGNATLGQVNPGTGTIILGETGNAFGAGLILSPNPSTNVTFANAITVRSGGYRTIRSTIDPYSVGGDSFYTLSGPITLDGNLDLFINANNADRRMVVSGNITGTGGLNLTKGYANGFFRLSGNNTNWSGNLTISRGTVEIRGNATNSAGTGHITIGTTGNTTATAVTFVPESSSGTVSYTNNITVNAGGNRTINGGNTNHNLTLSGNITLDGDLIVNHTWSASDRRINLNGPISGNGGLTVIRAGGSLETTLRMAGANTYLGNTTVTNGASLALAATASLASNVLVQAGGRIGGPGTINANLTLEDTANFFFYAVGSNATAYVPMSVNGTVTLSNNFSVANIVGGSRGEPVAWAQTPDGTYTLIGATASNLSNIQNFGSANYATIVATPTRYAYFQGTTGLQIVVSSSPPAPSDPFATWSLSLPFDVDSNGDGVDNGLAWFFGAGTPNDNAADLLPLPSTAAGALVLEFDCLSAADRGTAIFAVQYSSDIGQSDPWAETEIPGTVGTFTGGVVDFVVTDPGAPGGLLNVIATIPAGEAAAGRLFGRVIGRQ